MHICLITSTRAFEAFYGGEQRFTLSLRNWLIEHGQNVTIVGRKLFGVKIIGSDIKLNTKIAPVRTLLLPYPMYMLGMLITSMAFVLRVISLNRRSRISVIHAHDTGYGGLSAIISAKLLRVPIIISSHGVRYASLTKTLRGTPVRSLVLLFEHWLDVVTSKRADLVSVVAPSHKHVFAKLGIQKNKIKVTPIGIDVANFKFDDEARKAVRRELNVQDNFLTGFIGRFSQEKNLFTLLESFAQASKYADKMKLALVGTGPIENRLRTLCHVRGIDDKVIFTGIRYDIGRLLSALDIFLLPSYEEGCPTALLEAMAAGKAIVSSNIASVQDIVKHGDEAILVDPNSVEELKKAILLLYENSDLIVKLGNKAKEKAESYDIDEVCRHVLTMYEELIQRKHD